VKGERETYAIETGFGDHETSKHTELAGEGKKGPAPRSKLKRFREGDLASAGGTDSVSGRGWVRRGFGATGQSCHLVQEKMSEKAHNVWSTPGKTPSILPRNRRTSSGASRSGASVLKDRGPVENV